MDSRKDVDSGEEKNGAGDEIRTRDINLGKVALYQLSYSRLIAGTYRTMLAHGCGWRGKRVWFGAEKTGVWFGAEKQGGGEKGTGVCGRSRAGYPGCVPEIEQFDRMATTSNLA